MIGKFLFCLLLNQNYTSFNDMGYHVIYHIIYLIYVTQNTMKKEKERRRKGKEEEKEEVIWILRGRCIHI